MSDEEVISLWRSIFSYTPDGKLFRKLKSGQLKEVGSPCGRDKLYLNVRTGKSFQYVHRVIFGMHYGFLPIQVDHKVGYDNSPTNLRAANNQQNNCNVGRKVGRVPYRGVCKIASGRYVAKIRNGGRRIHLGCFNNPIDAAKAYNEAATKLHGEFAIINRSIYNAIPLE